MRLRLFCLLFYVSFSFATTPSIPLKEHGVLHVASYSEFKPISYGHGQGYEADLLKAIAQYWHVKIQFHPINKYEGMWLIPSNKSSPSDVAMGGLTPAGYRIKEGAVFSNTIASFDQSLLVRRKDKESGKISGYSSFKNTSMKIGVVPATTGERYARLRVKQHGLSKSVLVRFASESELLPALLNGEIDAIARGTIGNDYQAAHDKRFITIARKNYGEGFAFAVDSSNETLHKDIDQAIAVVTNKGKITYQEWLVNHAVFSQYVAGLS